MNSILLLQWVSSNIRKVSDLGSVEYEFLGANILNIFFPKANSEIAYEFGNCFIKGHSTRPSKFFLIQFCLLHKVFFSNCWWKPFPIRSMPPYHFVSQVKSIDNIFRLHFITFFVFFVTPCVNASSYQFFLIYYSLKSERFQYSYRSRI